MSNKSRPHYADQKGAIQLGLDGNILFAEGVAVPANGASGYAPGCHFFVRGAAGAAAVFQNNGTAAACAFALATGGLQMRAGVATVTGSGTVVTGLTTVTSVQATMQADASLTNGTTATATIGNQAGAPAAGSVILKVWKPTTNLDTTPIPSAAAVAVNWLAVGT